MGFSARRNTVLRALLFKRLTTGNHYQANKKKQGESVSPGGVSQLFEHTAPQSLSSADLPWATRIGEYNTRPSLHHRESL